MREKSLIKYKQSMILKGTIPQGYSLYDKNSTFISPIYTFPWRETFTRLIKVQIEKRTLFILFMKRKTPTLGKNEHPSVHFFLHGPRLFPLSTEKVQVRSAGNGHQIGSSRDDTININKNKKPKKTSIRGN